MNLVNYAGSPKITIIPSIKRLLFRIIPIYNPRLQHTASVLQNPTCTCRVRFLGGCMSPGLPMYSLFKMFLANNESLTAGMIWYAILRSSTKDPELFMSR